MFVLNKVIGYFASPAGLILASALLSLVACIVGRRRLVTIFVVFAFANCWLWSTPMMANRIGTLLEGDYLIDGRAPMVERLPTGDVIVLHGGSMGVQTNFSPYAEMAPSADRVWHAARVWKDQVERRKEKADGADIKILVTSKHSDISTGPLLADLGVPKDAIIYDFGPRNTEEEAKCVATNGAKKVLVVTSAWHMKRTMLMYRKYAPNVEAIPAPCDFEQTFAAKQNLGLLNLLPDPSAFIRNSVAVHEWLGYFGYKWLR